VTVALVTGAGSGIGEASARRLAADGAQVVCVDIDGERAEKVAADIDGLAVTADVSDEDDVDRYMAAALERYGRVDQHHLNAGIIGSFAPFSELTLAEFDDVIGVNLRGVFLGLRAAFRAYERQDSGGAIVVTASISGLRGSSDLIPYHTSKHGVIGLTRCAALTGPLGVRVNAVAPGIVLTGLFAQSGDVTGGGSDAVQRARNSALARPGEVEEIAALVAWLLSDEASFMTGEIVSIDGGATALNPVRPSGQPAQ
jgi:NAD(P)-dependent dehydrogenase (short-subunit alcohol dehydrogenase family)